MKLGFKTKSIEKPEVACDLQASFGLFSVKLMFLKSCICPDN